MSSLEIVRRLWEAAERQDGQAVFALYDPAIVWESHNVGSLEGGGRSASTSRCRVGTSTRSAMGSSPESRSSPLNQRPSKSQGCRTRRTLQPAPRRAAAA